MGERGSAQSGSKTLAVGRRARPSVSRGDPAERLHQDIEQANLALRQATRLYRTLSHVNQAVAADEA